MYKEPIGKGRSIYVNNKFKFSTDTILLANFAMPLKQKTVLELCAGNGAATFIWCSKDNPKHITVNEIQEDACELIKKTIKLNNWHDKIDILNCDLTELKDKEYIKYFNYFDSIICNPPYYEINKGKLSINTVKQTNRHEIKCSLKQIITVASKLLKFGGEIFICLKPERLCDALEFMREKKIEPKEIQFVHYNIDRSPNLFLLKGKYGANKNIKVLPPLIIKKDNDDLTDEMIKIYGDYLNTKGSKKCKGN